MATARQQNTAKPADFFPAMLRIAVDMECDIQLDQENRDHFTAHCPFHPHTSPNNARTLTIDSTTALFTCSACGAKGNPYAFAAMAWGVTANDAHLLLAHNGQQVTAERPPYPDPEPRQRNRWQTEVSNTAVMTRALARYKADLLTSYDALRYLAKLQIDPQKVVAAQIGFATGNGLEAHLLDNGVTPQEIKTSPLFDHDNDEETFTGKIILGDTDFTGGCIWLTSLSVTEAHNLQPWRHGRPPLFGIPAMKPDLMNLYSISPRTKTAVVTDDARLYIILAAEGTPTTLITQKRRPNTPIEERADRYARTLLRRTPRRAALVMHDRDLMTRLSRALLRSRAGFKTTLADANTISANIDPHTRDLPSLVKFPRDPRPPQKPEKEKGRQNAGPGTPKEQPAQRRRTQPGTEEPAPGSNPGTEYPHSTK